LRIEREHKGIGRAVSEFARNKAQPEPEPDFTDGVITVVKDEEGGLTQSFATFAEALTYSDDGDTLQVGKGTYAEAIDLDERVTIVGEEGAILNGSGITADAGTQGTTELFDGFSGGSISGLTVTAVQGGNAFVSVYGEAVSDVTFEGNTFDAGATRREQSSACIRVVAATERERDLFANGSVTELGLLPAGSMVVPAPPPWDLACGRCDRRLSKDPSHGIAKSLA
jgi:hypothetical protein